MLKVKKFTKHSEVYAEWGLSIEDSIALSVEHDATTHEAIHLRNNSYSSAPKAAPAKVLASDPTTTIQIFNVEVDMKKRVEDILIKINKSKYVDVRNRILSLEPIRNVICTKPKGERILIMNLMWKVTKGEHDKKIHVSDIVKYGYSEWLKIQAIIKTLKGIDVQELKLLIILMINKVVNMDLVFLPDKSSKPTTSFSARSRRRS